MVTWTHEMGLRLARAIFWALLRLWIVAGAVMHLMAAHPAPRPPAPIVAPMSAVQIAESQVGHAGPYTAGGFWCAKFVSWVETQAHTAGWRAEDGPNLIYVDHQASLTRTPQLGSLVYIDLYGGTRPLDQVGVTHIGIVVAVNGAQVTTVEGNAGPDYSVVSVHTRTVGDGYVVGFSPAAA